MTEHIHDWQLGATLDTIHCDRIKHEVAAVKYCTVCGEQHETTVLRSCNCEKVDEN